MSLIQQDFLECLICPDCGAGLSQTGQGGLTCEKGHHHAPRGGVPCLLPPDATPVASEEDSDSPSGISWAASHWQNLRIDKLLGPATNGHARLVNFGCAGATEKGFQEAAGWRVFSFDVYPTKGTDLLADGHKLPFRSGSIDVVTAFEVLEHLPRPWVAMEQIARVLRPGGRFVGSVAFLKPFHNSYFHMTHWGMKALVESAGMRLDEVYGGQSPFVHVLANMVPVGRRWVNPFMNKLHKRLLEARSLYWRRRNHLPSTERLDRFDPKFKLSFDEYQTLQYSATVLFSASKP